MFGEAGSETGSMLVPVELAKKYNKVFNILAQLVEKYNNCIIRIFFATYFRATCVKGTLSLSLSLFFFSEEQKI